MFARVLVNSSEGVIDAALVDWRNGFRINQTAALRSSYITGKTMHTKRCHMSGRKGGLSFTPNRSSRSAVDHLSAVMAFLADIDDTAPHLRQIVIQIIDSTPRTCRYEIFMLVMHT